MIVTPKKNIGLCVGWPESTNSRRQEEDGLSILDHCVIAFMRYLYDISPVVAALLMYDVYEGATTKAPFVNALASLPVHVQSIELVLML